MPAAEPVLAFSAEGGKTFWDAPYAPDAWLVFGSESRGLPPELRAKLADRLYRIPLREGERSLNLSTAAAVVVFEALRVLR